MKKIYILPAVLLTALLLFSGCSNKPKPDHELEKAVEEYVSAIQSEADMYFSALSDDAAGISDVNVKLGFRSVEDEYLKSDTKTLDEIISSTYPVLKVGLSKTADGEFFTDEEIHDIVVVAMERNICVDLYFNYNDFYVYQVGNDGVTIDITTAMDGGAYHKLENFEP